MRTRLSHHLTYRAESWSCQDLVLGKLVQKMALIARFLARAGGSSPVLVFQMAALAMLVSEHSMLEITYASTTKYLEEGETLNLNCLIKHQQDQSSQMEAHWYKKAMKQNETGFGKEMESLHLSQNSDPKAKVTSSLQLKIQNVSQSDSGSYQCRAKIKNTVLTAVGHFIRVNVTERTERDLEQNEALRVDSELEKMWAVVIISWITVYVKGLIP
ncbi:CD160 antigen [Theristicus caerulescens]